MTTPAHRRQAKRMEEVTGWNGFLRCMVLIQNPEQGG
jgi:hypothetical protein